MLERLATLCLEGDLVKFAKHEPTIEECSRAMERARDFVVGSAARCTPRPGQGTEPVAAAEPAAAVQGGAA
jgi:hypothetical protein